MSRGRLLVAGLAALAAAGWRGVLASAAAGNFAANGSRMQGASKTTQIEGRRVRNRSKYKPHQGAQECLRRRSGGWARVVGGKRYYMEQQA